MRIFISLLILWGTVFSAGCQANVAEAELPLEMTSSPVAAPLSTSLPASPTPGDIQMTPSLSTPADPALQALIENTKVDLAQRLSISVTQITPVEVAEVEWSDSSLDCPQPGMQYLQVITPGYRIVLRANDQAYEYHSNRDTYFILCENRRPPIIPEP